MYRVARVRRGAAPGRWTHRTLHAHARWRGGDRLVAWSDADEQEILARLAIAALSRRRSRRASSPRASHPRTGSSTSRAVSTTCTLARRHRRVRQRREHGHGPSWAPSPAASAWAPAPGRTSARTPSTTSRPSDLVAAATGNAVTTPPSTTPQAIMAYVAAWTGRALSAGRQQGRQPAHRAADLPGHHRRVAHQGRLLARPALDRPLRRAHHQLGHPGDAHAGDTERSRYSWPSLAGGAADTRTAASALRAIGSASDTPRHRARQPGARAGGTSAADRLASPGAAIVVPQGQPERRAAASPTSAGGSRTDADATSAAIQAILAAGESPRRHRLEARRPARRRSPRSTASSSSNGSYVVARQRSRPRPVIVTSWALVALSATQPFTSYPQSSARATRPSVPPVLPHRLAQERRQVQATHIVLIRATYTDFYPKGTGIKPSACRLYVDDKNRSKPADIGKYGLHLQLKNVANGDHTYRIELSDHAGNAQGRRAQVHRRRADAEPRRTAHADAPRPRISGARVSTPHPRRRPSRTHRPPRRRRRRIESRRRTRIAQPDVVGRAPSSPARRCRHPARPPARRGAGAERRRR